MYSFLESCVLDSDRLQQLCYDETTRVLLKHPVVTSFLEMQILQHKDLRQIFVAIYMAFTIIYFVYLLLFTMSAPHGQYDDYMAGLIVLYIVRMFQPAKSEYSY